MDLRLRFSLLNSNNFVLYQSTAVLHFHRQFILEFLRNLSTSKFTIFHMDLIALKEKFGIKPCVVRLTKNTFSKIKISCSVTSSETNVKLPCYIKQTDINTFSIGIRKRKLNSTHDVDTNPSKMVKLCSDRLEQTNSTDLGQNENTFQVKLTQISVNSSEKRVQPTREAAKRPAVAKKNIEGIDLGNVSFFSAFPKYVL